MRIAPSLVASALLFAIVQTAPAQINAPAPSPAVVPAASPAPAASPSATPGKHHRRKKAADVAPAASPQASAAPAPGTAPAVNPAPAPGMAPAATTAPATTAPTTTAPVKQTRAKRTPPTMDPNATPAPGGGPGMVWVNTKSHVYHQSTSRYYGKTKEGKYMSEQDAQAAGAHAAPHND